MQCHYITDRKIPNCQRSHPCPYLPWNGVGALLRYYCRSEEIIRNDFCQPVADERLNFQNF